MVRGPDGQTAGDPEGGAPVGLVEQERGPEAGQGGDRPHRLDSPRPDPVQWDGPALSPGCAKIRGPTVAPGRRGGRRSPRPGDVPGPVRAFGTGPRTVARVQA